MRKSGFTFQMEFVFICVGSCLFQLDLKNKTKQTHTEQKPVLNASLGHLEFASPLVQRTFGGFHNKIVLTLLMSGE